MKVRIILILTSFLLALLIAPISVNVNDYIHSGICADSGQRIVVNFNISILSNLAHDRYLLYNDLKSNFSPVSMIFVAIFIFLLADIIVTVRRK